MIKRNKLIIGNILAIILIILLSMTGTLIGGPDLATGEQNILILAADKTEQPGGGLDMAFMIHMENGNIVNYTPVYPGGMTHPTEPALGNLQGPMFLHDSLWEGTEKGMEYAKEIVEYNTGMHADAVIVVYDEGLDAIIDSIRPLEIDGVVTNLGATDIVRENDNYAGYSGRDSGITGTMSRGDAVLVLAQALSQAAEDPFKRNTMVKEALNQYSKGNIVMTPEGSFAKLMTSKGLESIL